MCICIAGNKTKPLSFNQLITEYSTIQLEKIVGSPFAQRRILAPLYENILRSSRERSTLLLENAGADYKQPLNELALWLSYKWKIGQEIKVKFLNHNLSPNIEPQIIGAAKEWEASANIKFKFVENEDAEIRISFNQDGTSWSRIGTDCLQVADQSLPTMHFGWFNESTILQEVRGTTLHEFGHALGCIHEHQQPAAGIFWDERAVIRGYSHIFGWNEQKIRQNILTTFPQSAISNSQYDTDSIMHYFFPSYFMVGNARTLKHNYELSTTDKSFIGCCYPF